MSTFNAASVLMPLDEYYKQCVEPKPITQRRSSYSCGSQYRRQAGHLRSYRDLDFPEEEENDDDEPVPLRATRSESLDDLFKSNEEDPNIGQIDFEMKDFDKLYSEETGTSSEVASNSAHGSDISSRSNVKSRLDLRAESRLVHYNRRPRNYINWNNRQQNRQGGYRVQRPSIGHASMEQRMRNAYNAFSNNPEPRNDTQIAVENHPKNIYSNQAVSKPNPQKSSVFSQVNSVSGPNFPDQRANNVVTSSTQPEMFGQGFIGNQQPLPEQTPNKTEKKIEVLGDLIGMDPTENSDFNAQEVARNVLLFLNSVSLNEKQEQRQNSNWMGGNGGYGPFRRHRFN